MLRKIRTAVTATVLAAGLCSRAALAGIIDSPLPVLEAGKKTYHLYSVPGVANSGAASVATYFYCTSTDTVPVRVGVEAFTFLGGPPYNDAVATSVSLDPGRTQGFVTSLHLNLPLATAVLGLNNLFEIGSARILATSKKVICTASVVDTVNTPPTASWQLTIVKQKTQKGD